VAQEGCPTFTDYCATDFKPGVCEGHLTVTFCLDSNAVATNTCTNTATYAVQIDEDGNKSLIDAPEELSYTDEICPLHPAASDEVTITSSAGKGGTITPTVTAARGSDITFYITPKSGYSINDVLLNGVSVGAVSSYTITDAQYDGTISVSFVKTGSDAPAETEAPTTEAPTTEAPTTEAPTTEEPTTEEPTTEAPPATEAPDDSGGDEPAE
jgi:penicillin-binding protein 1A